MHTELFNSNTSNAPVADTKNAAGGKAYSLDAAVALAKYACSGTLNDTYNCDAKTQLDKALALCQDSNPEFVAKLAVYARTQAVMKDVPALLTAYLARTNLDLCKKVFSRVINSPKMLSNFVQILRSGTINTSRSLGSGPRGLVRDYINRMHDEQFYRSSVGYTPSMADIVKMTHPKPATKERASLVRHVLGQKPKDEDKDYLLPLVKQYEAFKKGETKDIPNVPFQLLTSLPLTPEDWCYMAQRATFEQIRQSLNTYGRHGVFKNEDVVKHLATKLSDANEVRNSRVFPYQLFTTFMHLNEDVPGVIHNALQTALEIAMENVPVIDQDFVIALDTSGSMRNKVTGKKSDKEDKRVTTKARYIDVATLFASALVRKNKQGIILPFDTTVHDAKDLNSFDSLMTNAQKLARYGGGGTDCAAVLRHLNERKLTPRLVIYISDNESWQAYAGKKYRAGTGMMEEWGTLAKRSPNSQLINIDVSPRETSQIANVKNTLLVGGFNDQVFSIIAGYLRGAADSDYWVNTINEIKL